MNDVVRHLIQAPTGYSSREAALFMAQLDDQTRRLLDDLHDIGAEELQWQPAPGMNTIGMLLAHMAIVEVFWTQIGLRGDSSYDVRPQLGIGMDDDGMPIGADQPPPANLAGKPLSYYRDLLDRARDYVRHNSAGFSEADLDRIHSRTRRNGRHEEFSVRWVLYHLLEHFAGHYGQVLLLRHAFRQSRERTAARP